VFQISHHALAVAAMQELLFPHKGKYALYNYEKAFFALPNDNKNIYTLQGINQQRGCLVIVRTDQYIAQVLIVEKVDALEAFFYYVMLSKH
jgi:phenol 2-monooxygenase (NADPH)